MKGKNTESAQKSRENESDREVVDFLSSDWYAEQCEIYLPHIKCNKAKSRLDILKSFKLISKKLRKEVRDRGVSHDSKWQRSCSTFYIGKVQLS